MKRVHLVLLGFLCLGLVAQAVEALADDTGVEAPGAHEVVGVCIAVSSTLFTSITARDLRGAGIEIGDAIAVTLGSTEISMPLDYPPSSVPPGSYVAYLLWGELRMYQPDESLPDANDISAGTTVRVRLLEKAKYARPSEVTDLDRYWSDVRAVAAEAVPQLNGAPSDLPPLHVSGSRILDAEGREIVLRGVAVEDPYWALRVEARVLKRDLLHIKALGGNVVHIPVHPEAWKLVGGEAYINDYLDDLVMWCGELGLYAVISWKTHGDPETRKVSEEMYDPDMELALGALTLLAHRYADCAWVMYSVFNEPDAFMRWERFRLCMIDLVDAVRSQSPEAIAIVPGVNVAADLSSIPANSIPRGNVVYAADVYPWVWDKTPWREDALALLAEGYPLIVFEWGFDVPEDDAQFPDCCQYASQESFGKPLVDFCEENAISWTAWIWSNDWCPHMFYDDERLQPTAFGQVVIEGLSDEALP
jgi:hypothetical protein